MIVANRTLTTAIAGTVFAASALAIASQFLINATMSENGPVEYADGVLNAIIALTLTTLCVYKIALRWEMNALVQWNGSAGGRQCP